MRPYNVRPGITRAVVRTTMAVLLFTGSLGAQTRDDAIRLSTLSSNIGARGLGMGGAYTGVANDFSALFWNPAGLVQLRTSEFNVGLSVNDFANNTTFFGTPTSESSNATHLNSLGLVYPIPTKRGSAVIAFGYTRSADYNGVRGFAGFNPLSSIVQSWAPNGTEAPPESTMAEYLFLANARPNADTTRWFFDSPINDSLQQSGTILEGGGLDFWSFGGALDISKNVSLGLTLTYVSGSYRYDRDYRETDLLNIYGARYPWDVNTITSTEYIESNIAGFNALIGLMYREPEKFRLGFNIRTPMWLNIRETFGIKASSEFHNLDKFTYSGDDATEYDVHTPWVFSGGGSLTIGNLLLAADGDLIDWTSAEFKNAPTAVLDENKSLRTDMRTTVNYRLGAEYDLMGIGVRLRGGFGVTQSPYKSDDASFDQKRLTAGAGVLLGESAMLDFAYARTWWKSAHLNNDSLSPIAEDIHTNTFLLTLGVRF
jgi:long-subunit fatty acid transport protein